MKRTAPFAALALAALLVAGCSSSKDDDADPTTTKPTATTEQTTTTGGDTTTTEGADTGDAGSLPSYETAKRVYLAQTDDVTKKACQEDEEDKDLTVSSGTYRKLVCANFNRFEYIEGAENYEKNWPAIQAEQVYRSVFQVPGKLIVVPVGSNDDFAPALAKECGCGEVVVQKG